MLVMLPVFLSVIFLPVSIPSRVSVCVCVCSRCACACVCMGGWALMSLVIPCISRNREGRLFLFPQLCPCACMSAHALRHTKQPRRRCHCSFLLL